MRRTRTVLPTLLTALLLTACGAEETTPSAVESATPTASSSPAATESAGASSTPKTKPSKKSTPEPSGVVVEISISGDEVTPNGERVLADLGEPVVLSIRSDRPGELHVHSTPEQEVAFGSGRSKHELRFEQPGVIEVEDHDSGRVIVQLQVS